MDREVRIANLAGGPVVSETAIAGVTASFHSGALERSYRQEALSAHRRRAIPAVGFVALLAATLIVRDFLGAGWTAEFFQQLALRGPLMVFHVVVIATVARVRSAAVTDHVLLTWSVVVVAATIYVHFSRPVSPPSHHTTDVLMILIIALAVPNRFLYQALPAIGLAAASLLHIWLRESMSIFDSVGLWSAYVVSTLVGVFAAWQINVSERQLYLARLEIWTLSGIVPICAYCKSVRDDEGEWHQLEKYFALHTGADFSHGFCPTCYEREEAELDESSAPKAGREV